MLNHVKKNYIVGNGLYTNGSVAKEEPFSAGIRQRRVRFLQSCVQPTGSSFAHLPMLLSGFNPFRHTERWNPQKEELPAVPMERSKAGDMGELARVGPET